MNAGVVTITSANQLRELLNLVHDRWFNVERVALDKERKTVAMDLEAKKANLAKGSKDGIRLLIRNAEALTISDTEKVRDYDLNEIKFDAASGRLIITGGIPITIEVKVTVVNFFAVVKTAELASHDFRYFARAPIVFCGRITALGS